MKTKFIYYPLAVLAVLLIIIQACKKETTTTKSATITALTCTSATFSGTPVNCYGFYRHGSCSLSNGLKTAAI